MSADLTKTEAGQKAIKVAGATFPTGADLAAAVLAGDVKAAKAAGWRWGVECAAFEAGEGPNMTEPTKAEVTALANAVGFISYARRDGADVLYGGDLDPIEEAEKAVEACEFDDMDVEDAKVALREALFAATSGKEAGREAWAAQD